MKSNIINHWIAPQDLRLPDFIICGAMKCGTTTVHEILNSHPAIGIPNAEINFFDIDDTLEHSDFLFHAEGRWFFPDISENNRAYWKWYSRFFSEIPDVCLIGEDSTCYLASSIAPLRISLQTKPIKTIICLRHPTKRAYSQYWHMLTTGRALFNFEDTIRYTPHYVLSRSMYFRQIQNFLEYIPRERVFFFILEEYMSDRKAVVKRLIEYLELPFKNLPEDALKLHRNKGKIPKHINIQILKNRIFRSFGNTHYIGKLPYSIPRNMKTHKLEEALNKLHKRINPPVDANIPSMKPGTKMYLDHLFKGELIGLNELVGMNVLDLWFD